MPEISADIQAGKYEDVLAAVQSPVITLIELIKNASDSCTCKSVPIIIKIDTKQNIITITDSGQGLSKYDLDHLGEAGYSTKMVGGNIRSPIDNPLSGSKGLGLLTAFFIADTLEIETYSTSDKKSYYLEWKKGEKKYTYIESDSVSVGTVITLKNVDRHKLQMILLPEERVKLFMASLRFFTSNENLPQLKLVIDGVEESYYPQEPLESFYLRNKGSNSGFIAKASFQYENNTVYLSYEDNTSNFYNFSNKSINLEDTRSVDAFIKEIRAPEKGAAPIKSICDSVVFTEQYTSVNLPSFSGVLYTWRHRKIDDLEQWPVGVRIYINNYSLYRYLDKENDWLNLSEISQNVKATNYKLKNTYGYLDLTEYNESSEALKISKERNDFIDSLAQRKLIHIMRDVIIGTFTRIDMAVKNPQRPSFSLRYSNHSMRTGDELDLSSIIICSNLDLEDITIEYDESRFTINDDLIVTAFQAGKYEIKFSYGDQIRIFTLRLMNVMPEFSLSKSEVVIYKGNTVNLRDYISVESCKDVTPDSIEIVADNKETVIRNDLFDKNNKVGQHIVLYQYDDYQRTLVLHVKEIERQPGAGAKSPRIDILFPQLSRLRAHSIKLPELVDAISAYYVQAPTLCMAAIRILLESSAKAFLKAMICENVDDPFFSIVHRVINIRDCNENNPDYKKSVKSKSKAFVAEFERVSHSHEATLSKDIKRNINTHLDDIKLDMFVHNPEIVATDTTVYKSMQVFAPVLNYIFEVLLIDKQ